MNEPPKKDEDERFMPGDDSGEVVQTPFDRLLSRTLMQKESAQELVRSHLPPEFVAHLKPETLEQADTSFIDANLKRRFATALQISDCESLTLGWRFQNRSKGSAVCSQIFACKTDVE
jgi:hypothetical protein